MIFLKYINLLNHTNRFIMFQPFISSINILYTLLYIVFFCFNGLCFLVLVRFIDSMFISAINLQFYFLMFLLLILISKLYSSCKMSWGVLALLVFCRLNKDIISSLKLCYNSFIKLCKPVVRRN